MISHFEGVFTAPLHLPWSDWQKTLPIKSFEGLIYWSDLWDDSEVPWNKSLFKITMIFELCVVCKNSHDSIGARLRENGTTYTYILPIGLWAWYQPTGDAVVCWCWATEFAVVLNVLIIILSHVEDILYFMWWDLQLASNLKTATS